MHIQRGFSLIELLMALALAAVLLVLTVPAMMDFQARRAVDAAAGILFSDLALARAEAIRRGNFVTICRSIDGQVCDDGAAWEDGWLMFAGPAAGQAPLNVLRVQGALQNLESLQLNLGINQPRVAFGPTGLAMAAAGRFTLIPRGAPGMARLICLSRLGVARLQPQGATEC